MHEAFCSRIADRMLSGMRTYVRRAHARSPKPGTPSARVLEHIESWLRDEDRLRRKIALAVARAQGRADRAPNKLVEVLLDVLGPMKGDFLACVIEGLPTGRLRAAVARGYDELARDCDDAHFDCDSVTASERRIRGLEESLHHHATMCSLERFLADLGQGPIALLKRAIRAYVGHGVRPGERRLLEQLDPAAMTLLSKAVMAHPWTSRNPKVWIRAVEMLRRGKKLDHIADHVHREEAVIAAGGAEMRPFDEDYVTDVNSALKELLAYLRRLINESDDEDGGQGLLEASNA